METWVFFLVFSTIHTNTIARFQQLGDWNKCFSFYKTN